MQFNAEFWAAINQAVWNDLFNHYANVFPPCDLNSYVITTFSITHCVKIFNDVAHSICILLPCEEEMLCEKVYEVCVESYTPPPAVFRKTLVSVSGGPTTCPPFIDLDPNIYPPNVSWTTPCFSSTACEFN